MHLRSAAKPTRPKSAIAIGRRGDRDMSFVSNRYRAAIVHLLISVAIALVFFVLFRLLWYPGELFRAVGGGQLFALVVAIDVVMGPLLTLIVFKPDKPSLRFDLTVIGVLQTIALAYGVQTLFVGRPVYIAVLGHRVDVVQASEIDPEDLRKANQRLPLTGPIWVGYKPPKDRKERETVLFGSLGGKDYGQLPQYHAPVKSMRADILTLAKSAATLRQFNIGKDAEIAAWLAKHGTSEGGAIFLGLRARAEDLSVVFDAKTAEVIGIAPFKPWP